MFQGSIVAIVTPMHTGVSAAVPIDWEALRQLVEFHISQGSDAIVTVGTTGESATLNEEEHCQVIGAIVAQVDGRIPVIAGTGANSTTEASKVPPPRSNTKNRWRTSECPWPKAIATAEGSLSSRFTSKPARFPASTVMWWRSTPTLANSRISTTTIPSAPMRANVRSAPRKAESSTPVILPCLSMKGEVLWRNCKSNKRCNLVSIIWR